MPSDAPADVVDRQFEAYNEGDADAFAAEFADDAVVADLSEDEPTAVGRDEIHAVYGDQFEAVAPEAEILQRLTLGEYVVDHERVTQADGSEMEAIGVYRVVDGEIVGLWLATA